MSALGRGDVLVGSQLSVDKPALERGGVQGKADASDGDEGPPNEYLMLREANIQRNNALLQMLGLAEPQLFVGKPAGLGKRVGDATRPGSQTVQTPDPVDSIRRKNPERSQTRPDYKEHVVPRVPVGKSKGTGSRVTNDESASESPSSCDSDSEDYDSESTLARSSASTPSRRNYNENVVPGVAGLGGKVSRAGKSWGGRPCMSRNAAAVSEEQGGADEDESAGGVPVGVDRATLKRHRPKTAVSGDKTPRDCSKTGADGDDSAGGVGVDRGIVKRQCSKTKVARVQTAHRHRPETAKHNLLITPAHFPCYQLEDGQIIIERRKKKKQGRVMHGSWAQLIKGPEDQTGLLAQCPVLANLPALTMHYLHRVVWRSSSGGVQVGNGGAELPDVNPPISMQHWLDWFTDGERHRIVPNFQGGIKFFSCLQLAGTSCALRASPHPDHRYMKRRIIGCDVVWVSFSKSKGLQESEVDQLPDEEHMKLLQYGHVECFFSFASRDAHHKCHTQDMALVRKMHRLEYEGCGTLLATCADTESNPKGTKMLQVINVNRILANAVLVRHEKTATIPCSWTKQVSNMPDGISADSSDGKGDGSSLWHLPVHVRRRHG